MTDKPRWIYFVQGGEGGPVKIGIATRVQDRIDELQVGVPFKLRMLATRPGDLAFERALHIKHAAHNLHGEWFNPSSEVLSEAETALGFEQAPMRRKNATPVKTVASKNWEEFVRNSFPVILKLTGLRAREIAALAGTSYEAVKSWHKRKAMPGGLPLVNLIRGNDLIRAWSALCVEIRKPNPSATTQEFAARLGYMADCSTWR